MAFTASAYTGADLGVAASGAVISPAMPVAIQLRSFDAALNQDKVDLSWSTAGGANSHYFAVERSKDGELWAEVVRAEGAGNNTTLVEYADFDPNPLKGVSYYRLRQTDAKGNHVYSQVVVVKNNKVAKSGANNANNSFDEFTGFGDEEVLVLVHDMKGNEFYSKVYLVGKGDNLKAITLDHYLSAGIYLVVAASDENLVSRKIVVE